MFKTYNIIQTLWILINSDISYGIFVKIFNIYCFDIQNVADRNITSSNIFKNIHNSILNIKYFFENIIADRTILCLPSNYLGHIFDVHWSILMVIDLWKSEKCHNDFLPIFFQRPDWFNFEYAPNPRSIILLYSSCLGVSINYVEDFWPPPLNWHFTS